MQKNHLKISEIWIKTLSKLEIPWDFLNLIKDICAKPITDIMLKWNTTYLSPNIKKETQMSTLITSFSIVLAFLTKTLRQEKQMKVIQH